MAFETKNPTSFADIISFRSDTKSERGPSPKLNRNEAIMETISLRSKSPSAYSGESNAWSSPVQKEAIELSARKRNAVLNMIEKNWKINIRSKIESDLTDQVQQALAPLTNLRKKSEKKKTDRQRNLQVFKVNNFSRNRFSNLQPPGGAAASGSFKYIDVNYIPQHKILAGRDGRFYSKEGFPRSLANLRLPKRHEVTSQSFRAAVYNLDEMTRAQKHAANIRGGLDVTLLDSHSSVSFLSLPKPEDGDLRPLMPNVINYNGISLPNYGANRRCFQTYTKEGMNSLLSSRARRGKLTDMGNGKFIDKRGVVISRLGPFWPQGYGPVCRCPEFIMDCPKREDLLPLPDVQQQTTGNVAQYGHGTNDKSDSMSPRNYSTKNTVTDSSNNRFVSDSTNNRKPINHTSYNNFADKISNGANIAVDGDVSNFDSSYNVRQNNVATAFVTKQQENQRNLKNSKHSIPQSNPPQWNQNSSNQLTPRDFSLKPPINQGGKRQGQNGGKPVWKGKPVIYDCDRSSRAPLPHSVPEGLDESLIFESRFESGNLRQVRRIGEHEYELVLRTDMYTNRHTQWYYFRLQKAKQNRTYKFNIINFLKKDSLYNYGMKPLVYSEKLASNQELGWHRIGENIKYAAWNNPTRNAILSLDMQYYCLEFEVSFDWEEIEEDTVYLAHCYPYTYSDLRRHLDHVMSRPELSQHVKREVLCETTAGNACFLLTITDFPDREKDKYKDLHQEKKGVVITARVHPGESQSSWMMKGVIEHLISDHPVAQQLRQKFVFKIVPMLNPDGVIVGNYRTSLAARDLNRNYRHPRQGIFPTIWHTKQMVDQFNKDHPIILYCDLHGHSRKHMVFMYGCERKAYYQKQNKKQSDNTSNKTPPEKTEPAEKTYDPMNEMRDFVEERMFPWLMHKLAPTRFSFHGTKFAVRRSKEATGRVVMFRQMGIWNSFTMEASFSGTRMDRETGRHFNIDDFQLIGRKLCDCVLEYCRVCDNPIAKSRAILEMTKAIAQQLIRNVRVSTNPVNANDAKVNNTNNQVNKKTNQQNKNNFNLNNSLPNFANVKSTIAKQVRRSQNKQSNKTTTTMQSNRTDDEANVDDVIAPRSQIRNVKNNAKSPASEISQSIVDVVDDKVIELDAVSMDKDDVAEEEEEQGVEENCFRLLQSLNVHQMELESETSSESNSDSEPELPVDASSPTKNRTSVGNSSGGKKKKKKKRQQKFGKSISAPSKIQSLQNSKKNPDESQKDTKPKPPIPNYPGYVNKYANRSNGGIPIFAQERMEERAARRLAELKLAEKDRKHQENQLREQLLLAGIQDGPTISYDVTLSRKLCDEHEGYSDVCGVRYKMANPAQKVQYMLSNPYRGTSPNSARERRPVVTMRFSPPSQLRHQAVSDIPRNKPPADGNIDLYMPYRVQAAAGRLSNQRELSSLTELSGSVSESNPTEPSSSQSSERGADEAEAMATVQNPNKFEPRSVVVPLQKYNVSFNTYKKNWKNKSNGTAVHRPQEVEELDLVSADQENLEEDLSAQLRPNVSDLILPPNMDVTEVMTAHMRYPGQVHRVEAMRPLPRGRTISRGPPMVFGEPAPFTQKSLDISTTEPLNGTIHRIEAPSTNSALFVNHKPVAHHPKRVDRNDVITSENIKVSSQKDASYIHLNGENSITGLNQSSPIVNPQPLFVPRFVALPPQRGANQDDGIKDNLTDRDNIELTSQDAKSHPFTVR